MDYKLVIIAGDAKQKVVKIKPPTIIGRSREVDIPVGHPLVSRKHCEITVGDDGILIVEDLGSLNGTYHGDQRITEPVYLEPGDTLTVGSITFQAQYGDFQDDQAPPTVPPSAEADTKDVEDELPDFLSAPDDEDDIEDVVEESEDEEGFPDFEASAPETEPAEPVKKRRPPPPTMEAPEDVDEDIEDFLDDVEEVEEVEDAEEADEVEADEEVAEESTSDISVGAEHEDVDIEEEVEVAAGDSRAGDSSSGDSGSDMGWLTGDDDDAGDSKDSGLDDFFKSL